MANVTIEETENIATREEMKKEAVERLKILGIFPQALKEYKKEGLLNLTEVTGALYWLKKNEIELMKSIKAIKDCEVYHVIKTASQFGVLYNFLLVSKYKEEWEYDRNLLKENIVFSYVANLGDVPYHTTEDTVLDYDTMYSEFGNIGVENRFGGLIRTF